MHESKGPQSIILGIVLVDVGLVAAIPNLLGHERFAVAGHDRGSYVAFRMAMDQGRLWFSDWIAGEIIAIDDAGLSELIVGHESLPLCFVFYPPAAPSWCPTSRWPC